MTRIIDYKQALKLKQLGFDEKTTEWSQNGEGVLGDVTGKKDYYNRKGDVYTALPTFYQTFRWFREVHDMHQTIEYDPIDTVYMATVVFDYIDGYATYEAAEDACLDRLIQVLEARVKAKIKQSSIEWLIENLAMAYPKVQEMRLLVDKAKWMHKEEITNAWDAGYDEIDRATASPIKYYHETFNTKEK